jgi:hypothetical protein
MSRLTALPASGVGSAVRRLSATLQKKSQPTALWEEPRLSRRVRRQENPRRRISLRSAQHKPRRPFPTHNLPQALGSEAFRVRQSDLQNPRRHAASLCKSGGNNTEQAPSAPRRTARTHLYPQQLHSRPAPVNHSIRTATPADVACQAPKARIRCYRVSQACRTRAVHGSVATERNAAGDALPPRTTRTGLTAH